MIFIRIYKQQAQQAIVLLYMEPKNGALVQEVWSFHTEVYDVPGFWMAYKNRGHPRLIAMLARALFSNIRSTQLD